MPKIQLSFRSQFILAPFIIIALLAALVVYTLMEISNINRSNEAARLWEIASDRVHTAAAGSTRLQQILQSISSARDFQQDDHYFDYLEQSRLLADSLLDPIFFTRASAELQQLINTNTPLLRQPETALPAAYASFLQLLQPPLDYQYKIFSAQRRTAFITNHRQLVQVSERLTTLLTTALISCIVLALALSLWGLRALRKRLRGLREIVDDVCAPAPAAHTTARPHDEIAALEGCLHALRTRLSHAHGVESAFIGAEKERRRIAMEMHDSVLADLTAVHRQLELALNSPVTRQELEALHTAVNDVICHLRRTIDDLHPQVLETLGLESALESFLKRHSGRPQFPKWHFDFDPQLETRLPNSYKLNVFRIVTEAVTNILKHARCDRFEISMRTVDDTMIVTVEDNGIGMRENEAAPGHGRPNMTERARVMGATCQWRASRFGNGTCVEILLPVAHPQ